MIFKTFSAQNGDYRGLSGGFDHEMLKYICIYKYLHLLKNALFAQKTSFSGSKYTCIYAYIRVYTRIYTYIHVYTCI